MREHPNTAELLAIAREVLRNDVLPLLPKDKSYDMLMALNAIGIAERQVGFGEAPVKAIEAGLEKALGAADSLDAQLRKLAHQIREGAIDNNEAVKKLIWEMTVQRVRESAPKALKPYGLK